MRFFTSLDDLPPGFPERPVHLAIGVFDGLHLGHRALIGHAIGSAKAAGNLSGVLTFRRHPLALLAPPYEPPRLVSSDRRRELLDALGLDLLVEVDFTPEFAAVEAELFVRDHLAKRLRVAEVVCGATHRFGRMGKGDRPLLESLGRELGFVVHGAPTVRLFNSDLSSTAVREWLLRGDVDRARDALARPYELAGRVVEGDRRGRTIGFPTANLEPIERLLVPGRGVYACWAELGDAPAGSASRWPAMVNVGSRPTFDGARETVEAHLLGYSGDLYGQALSIHFAKRLRDERRFDGVEALRAQLAADAEATRAALRTGA